MRLDWENRDNKIVRKARVTEKSSELGKSFAQTADQRQHTQLQHYERDQQIDGEHGSQLQMRPAPRFEAGIQPLRRRPEKAEPGMNGRAKVHLGRS